MSRVLFNENATAPGTPSSGKLLIYAKTDSELYKLDDAGTEVKLTTSAFSTATGLTAGTTQTQAGGLDLAAQINEVSTVANSGDTVVLPTAVAGDTCIVVNNGANDMNIFPAVSDDLGAGADTVMTISLAAGDMATFYAYDATNWAGTVEIRVT